MMFPGLRSLWNQANPVSGLDGVSHLLQDPHPLLQPHLQASGTQGLAMNELHGNVGTAVLLTNLVDLADVLVFHSGLGARLLSEASEHVRVGFFQELEGDVSVQGRIEGLIHSAHSPSAQEGDDLVASNGSGQRAVLVR
jgi:hypothetical protein